MGFKHGADLERSGMNKIEKRVKQKYERLGYTVCRAGAPDFMLLKRNKISFVEVKLRGSRLTKTQQFWKEILVNAGFDFMVERPDGVPESKSLKESHKDPMRNKRISEGVKKAWKRKDVRDRMIMTIRKAMQKFKNNPEFLEKVRAGCRRRSKNKVWLARLRASQAKFRGVNRGGKKPGVKYRWKNQVSEGTHVQ